MPDPPLIRNLRAKWIKSGNLVRIVWLARAICNDGHPRTDGDESVPHPWRYGNQHVVLIAHVDLLQFTVRWRVRSVIVQDELDHPEWHRVVQGHPTVNVPALNH